MVVAVKLSWPYGKVTPAGGGTWTVPEVTDCSVLPAGTETVTLPPGVDTLCEPPLPGFGFGLGLGFGSGPAGAVHWTEPSVDVDASTDG